MAARPIPSFANGYAPRDGPPEYPHLHQGLVGYWSGQVGKQGKNRVDLSGNHNTGVMTNFTDVNAAEVRGDPRSGGHALAIVGSDDWVSLTLPAMSRWSMWAHVFQRPRSTFHRWFGDAGTLELRWASASGWTIPGVFEDTDVGLNTVNTWKSAVITGDSVIGETNVYVDGVNTFSVALALAVTSGLYVFGNRVGTKSRHANAHFADHGWWDRVISENEIQALFNHPDALLQLRRDVFPAAVVGGAGGSPLQLESPLAGLVA